MTDAVEWPEPVGTNRKLDYDVLFDGAIHSVEANGRTPEAVRNSLASAAKYRGVRVRTAVRGTDVFVQYLGPREPAHEWTTDGGSA